VPPAYAVGAGAASVVRDSFGIVGVYDIRRVVSRSV